MTEPLDHVRGYYAALDTGDADAIAGWFCDDAVHYYTRLGPHVGGRTIAEVRAYHHSGPKNRSGDLLGFDHARRGHTTL